MISHHISFAGLKPDLAQRVDNAVGSALAAGLPGCDAPERVADDTHAEALRLGTSHIEAAALALAVGEVAVQNVRAREMAALAIVRFRR